MRFNVDRENLELPETIQLREVINVFNLMRNSADVSYTYDKTNINERGMRWAATFTLEDNFFSVIYRARAGAEEEDVVTMVESISISIIT